jgi:hypothetical protein
MSLFVKTVVHYVSPWKAETKNKEQNKRNITFLSMYLFIPYDAYKGI